MNRYEFVNIISGFEPDEGMKERLEKKILGSGQHQKRPIRHITGAAAASICAAAIMCGVTVSAITLGWTERLFGSSAAVISENPDEYKVELGNVVTQSTGELPCSFAVGDVISDGESLYINMFIDGLPEDFSDELSLFVSNYGDFESSRFSGEWITLDSMGNTALMINPENGVNKGDRFDIDLEVFSEAENDLYIFADNASESDETEIYQAKKIGSISFTVESEINHMAKVINVENTAVIANNYTVKHTPENPYGDLPDSIEFYVRSIKISPLKYSVNGVYFGNMEGNDDIRLLLSPNNFCIIYKNGDVKEIAPDNAGGSDIIPGGSSEWIIEKHFNEVIDIENAAAVQIGDLIIPIE